MTGRETGSTWNMTSGSGFHDGLRCAPPILRPVCGWEDDEVQFRDPTYEGGANSVSLEQARNNFSDCGAVDNQSLMSVRKPLPKENPG